ncbi:MAG: hypothetical protein NTY53_20625 [Kiritimatiellaeota bacterium]|nr:hypothetical protein [Kiritimatiellota bacterium]
MKSGGKQFAVGVDFGGTSVKLALVNAQGKIVAREKFVTADAASQARSRWRLRKCWRFAN